MNARILVVEDEPVVAMDLRQRLIERGYVVVGMVGNADAAVEKVIEEAPDLVLMDIMLSGTGDGIDAAARIRAVSSVPIVYVTAYADDTTIERAKRTDASGYVVKPFRDRELHATIQVALQRYETEHSAENQLRKVARALSGLRGSTLTIDAEGKITLEPSGGGDTSEDDRQALDTLTPRERSVARALLAGMAIDRAAEKLGISRHTVRNHLKAIFRKLGVHSQVELVRRFRDLETRDEEQ